MEIKKINNKINEYVRFLIVHQKEGNINLKMTFNHGYWWCISHPEAQRLEKYFLEEARDIKGIISVIEASKSVQVKSNFLCLLGWSENQKIAGEYLARYILHPVPLLHNSSARALFPLIMTGKYEVSKEMIFNLLHKPSIYAKNKALGTLAYMPTKDISKLIPQEEWKYIKKLTNSKVAIVSNAAKAVIARKDQVHAL